MQPIESREMNIQQYLQLLIAHIRLISIVLMVVVTVVGVFTYYSPKMYTAYTSLNFDFKGGNPFADARSVTARETTYLATQIDLIQSQNVAQKVVDSLNGVERSALIEALDRRQSVLGQLIGQARSAISSLFEAPPPELGISTEGVGETLAPQEIIRVENPYHWLSGGVLGDLEVTPSFGSRIVEISYSSTNPKVAALIANRVAEAYVDKNLEMIVDPARRTKTWFDEQLKSLRVKLEASQERLTDYQQQQGVVATDERVDTETSRLSELSSQLVIAQQNTRDAVTSLNRLQEVLGEGKSPMTMPAVFNNPVVQAIKSELRQLEIKQSELSSKLGENHPKLQQINTDLKLVRGRLNKEVQSIADGINSAARLASTRETSARESLDAQKALVLGLKRQRDDMAVLMREVESAQATYNTALRELNESSMQSVVDQTNVYVVDPASVPSRRSSPQVIKNMILGTMVGLVLGIGWAILLELFNRKVRSREDIEMDLGIPVLGILEKRS